jgi:germination protein M
MRSLAALSLAALLVAACGGDDSAGTTIVDPAPEPKVLSVFMLREGKVEPVTREMVVDSRLLPVVALDLLLKGPTQEEARAGLESAIPENAKRGGLEVAGDMAIVGVTPALRSVASRAQIVYTLTALPDVKRVSFGGATPVRRGAFENQTPAILVESPLPGEEVESGFQVTGTANTFEATFQYELRDSSDKVVSKDFVTATSGSGTRGTFRFTVDYEVSSPQEGRLVVFEISAEDGSRTHESSIPLALR